MRLSVFIRAGRVHYIALVLSLKVVLQLVGGHVELWRVFLLRQVWGLADRGRIRLYQLVGPQHHRSCHTLQAQFTQLLGRLLEHITTTTTLDLCFARGYFAHARLLIRREERFVVGSPVGNPLSARLVQITLQSFFEHV